VLALVSFPFSPSSRRACWAFLKLVLLKKGDAEVVGDLLLQNAHGSGMQEINQWMVRRMSGWFLKPLLGSFIILLLLPWIFMAMFAYMIVTIVPLMFFGPLLALEWRDRRYLADATAVQLTRNPNAVAQAIVGLTEHGGILAGQKWSDLLFMVGAEIWTERANRKYEQALIKNRQALADASIPERMSAGIKIFNEWKADRESAKIELDQSEKKQKSWKARLGFVGTFHPSINRRMLRLRALGANVPWQYRREVPIIGILVAVLFLFVGLMIVGAFYQMLMNPH
jgi:hypothetical protein